LSELRRRVRGTPYPSGGNAGAASGLDEARGEAAGMSPGRVTAAVMFLRLLKAVLVSRLAVSFEHRSGF
jgi:hypothetical protein